MKKVLIGGFFVMAGTIWELAVIIFVGNNLVSGWSTPPGRFLTTVSQSGLTFPLVVASIILIFGFVILVVEYFKKDN